MRFISRFFFRFSLQCLFAVLCVQPAWSQSQPPIKPKAKTENNIDSKTENKTQKTINFQNNSKDPNFAEKQYLAPANALTYRDKYSVTCLIYVYSRSYLTLSIDITVFSTYKINRCDPVSFIKTTAAGVKAQVTNKLPANFVVNSGPHIQMMDFNNTPVENPFISIGTLNYSPTAKANIGILDLIQHFHEWSSWIQTVQYYNPLKTIQDTDYTWFPNSKLYKLITDKNETFLMSHLVATDLIIDQDDIENVADQLGKYMNLPKGWRYEVTVLDKILQIKQRQYAKVSGHHMQDEFGNIYIQLSEDIKSVFNNDD